MVWPVASTVRGESIVDASGRPLRPRARRRGSACGRRSRRRPRPPRRSHRRAPSMIGPRDPAATADRAQGRRRDRPSDDGARVAKDRAAVARSSAAPTSSTRRPGSDAVARHQRGRQPGAHDARPIGAAAPPGRARGCRSRPRPRAPELPDRGVVDRRDHAAVPAGRRRAVADLDAQVHGPLGQARGWSVIVHAIVSTASASMTTTRAPASAAAIAASQPAAPCPDRPARRRPRSARLARLAHRRAPLARCLSVASRPRPPNQRRTSR